MHTVMALLLLTARVYNMANVPNGDRVVATRVATNILRQAGIDVLWADCTSRPASREAVAQGTCLAPPSPDEVIVRMVASPSSGAKKWSGDTLGDAYVDTAAASGSLATVYVDRVGRMSRASGVDAGTLLGRVTAHEIGHLLLGTPSHGPTGLMRAQWSATLLQRRLANDWRFSKPDAAQAREGVLRREGSGHLSPAGTAPATLPCAESATLSPATCPSCPVCAISPADRMAFHLIVEPGL